MLFTLAPLSLVLYTLYKVFMEISQKSSKQKCATEHIVTASLPLIHKTCVPVRSASCTAWAVVRQLLCS